VSGHRAQGGANPIGHPAQNEQIPRKLSKILGIEDLGLQKIDNLQGGAWGHWKSKEFHEFQPPPPLQNPEFWIFSNMQGIQTFPNM